MSKNQLISPPEAYQYIEGDNGETIKLEPCHACDDCDAHGGLMACAKAIDEYRSTHNDQFPPDDFCYMSDGWVNTTEGVKEYICAFCFEVLRKPIRKRRTA